MRTSVVVVIPCYNEAERLPVDKFKAWIFDRHGVRILFVNDGSVDATLQVLRAIRDHAPDRFEVCDLPENVGKAEAVRIGILLALDSEPDYIGYWDADLATPLEAISAFCDLLDVKRELLMVFGARVRLLGRHIERRELRHYLGRIFATVASLSLGLGIYDTQCGAKLFRVSPEVRSLFQDPFLTRWLFDVEIIARLIHARKGTGLAEPRDIIYEFPLHEWRDVAGSKVKPQDFALAFIDLARIYWRYLRPQRGDSYKRDRSLL